MKRSMIIVAGGTGTRMGAEIPKQFIELNGKPILMHTMLALQEADGEMELILVLPNNQIQKWKKLCEKHSFNILHVITDGGNTRFLSVRNGLKLVTDSKFVGVHDGVRPFVSKSLLDECFAGAEKSGAAVPSTPVVQSLRKVDKQGSQAVDRSAYVQVQTPQCFKTEVLKDAFEKADRVDFSDDAAVVEDNGGTISLVNGDLENIKITSPFDLKIAELIAARRD